MKTGFFILLLISTINGILGSFPFDLNNISKADENIPQISFLSLDSSSQRPIGEFPPEFKKRPQVSEATATPSDISSTKMKSKNSSFDAPVAKKRRVNFKAITPDMTVEEIIETEIKECGFSKVEKIRQYRKTLQLIAQNDREAFDEDEVNFKAIFNHKTYIGFKKDNVDFYLLRFMIMFGADKLVMRRCGFIENVSDESHRFSEAFNYLLKTKPFNVVIAIFGKNVFGIEAEAHAKMIQAIREQYPTLPVFKNAFVDCLENKVHMSLLFDAFMEDDERTAFSLLLNYYKSINMPLSQDERYSKMNFHKIPLHFPELYLELDDASKFIFIKICLFKDDVKTFEKLINLDSNIILFINTMSLEHIERLKSRVQLKRRYSSTSGRIFSDYTILHQAIYNSAYKCIRFLSEIAPELLVASTPLMKPALKIAFHPHESEIIEIFFDAGYNELSLVKDFDGKEYNFIQYFFCVHSHKGLEYFVSKAGKETVINEIKKIWRTTEEILVHLLNSDEPESHHDYRLYVLHLFDIDKNATYRYKNREGNILIYVESVLLRSEVKIPGVDPNQMRYIY